jgi:hypothetical protein
MKSILVYGLEKNETRDYMESLLASNCKNLDDVKKVIDVARQHGYHSFRMANYTENEMPNFINTVRI